MRSLYLPEEWSLYRLRSSTADRSGGQRRGFDDSGSVDGTFKVWLFWIVSRTNNCQYCLGHQESKLLGAGLKEEQIAALDGDWSEFTPAQRAAFAFARLRFRGRDALFLLYLATLMIPFQVTMIPNYMLINQLGLLNTVWGVVVPNLCSAFAVLMLRQHMEAFPREILEASQMDGRTSWGTLWRVVVPNLRPALAALGIMLFISAWNEYLWPLIVINDQKLFVLNLALPALRGPYGNEYGTVLAGATLATVPVVAVFVFMQRQFIEGIMAGALKS